MSALVQIICFGGNILAKWTEYNLQSSLKRKTLHSAIFPQHIINKDARFTRLRSVAWGNFTTSWPHDIKKTALRLQLQSTAALSFDLSFRRLYHSHLVVQLKILIVGSLKRIRWVISKAPESKYSKLSEIQVWLLSPCICLVRKENNFWAMSLNPSLRIPAMCPCTNGPTVGISRRGSCLQKAFRCVMKNKQVKSGEQGRSIWNTP